MGQSILFCLACYSTLHRRPLSLVGADCVSLASPLERRGKSRSRRRTSSPHRTRLRWASAGTP